MYKVTECSECNGTGYRIIKFPTYWGREKVLCPAHPRLERVKCDLCKGTGQVKRFVGP